MLDAPQLRCVFFFNDTATTEIYTLSLHDALPILAPLIALVALALYSYMRPSNGAVPGLVVALDRKSTRLNSSHSQISYAVFCLKKKKSSSTLLITTSVAECHSFDADRTATRNMRR